MFLPPLDLLQARPPTPQEVQGTAFIIGLLAVRLAGAPLLYAAARKTTGNEMWFGALGLVSPVLALFALVMARRPRPAAAQPPWNPWVLCPFCAVPRGNFPGPCPRCGFFLPGPLPMAPVPPAPAPGPPPRKRDVIPSHVFGTLLFGYGLAAYALVLVMVPFVPFFDAQASEAAIDALAVAPWFVLVQALLLDVTLLFLLLDQAFFQKRLTPAEAGLTLGTPASFVRNLLVGLGAGGLTFAFSALYGQVLIDLLRALGAPADTGELVGQPVIGSPSDYMFWLLAAVVVAPLGEELFFRGYALAGLARKSGPGAGLFLSSALFAGVHLNPVGFVPLFFAGMVLGTLFMKTGSLAAPITAHAVNNLIVTTLVYLGY